MARDADQRIGAGRSWRSALALSAAARPRVSGEQQCGMDPDELESGSTYLGAMSSGGLTRDSSINPQTWRWSHPRVLVEDPDEKAGLAIASGLRFAGYAVAVCPGPRGHGQCPLTGPKEERGGFRSGCWVSSVRRYFAASRKERRVTPRAGGSSARAPSRRRCD